MEAFLRYARETRDALAPDYRPHPLASPVTPSPTDRTTLAFSSRVPRANVRSSFKPIETQRPRARGVLPPLHGAGHGRRGRGAHLEAAGHRPRDRRYGLQPGVRVVAPEMRDPMRCHHHMSFVFYFFFRRHSRRSRRSLIGAARSSSRLLARRSARCFRTSTTYIAMTDARDLNPN